MKTKIKKKDFLSLKESTDFKKNFSEGKLGLNEMIAVAKYGDFNLFYELFTPFHEIAKKLFYIEKKQQLHCLIPEELAITISQNRRHWHWAKEICWPYLVTEKVLEYLVSKTTNEKHQKILWHGSASYGGLCSSYSPSMIELLSAICPGRKDLREIVMNYFYKLNPRELIFSPVIHTAILEPEEVKKILYRIFKARLNEYDTKVIIKNLCHGGSNTALTTVCSKLPDFLHAKVLYAFR